MVPIGTILPIEYTSPDVSVYQKRYFGNVEYESFANDTTVQVRIHNAEGYVSATLSNGNLSDLTYNYYRRDHLGNIVSVWDAINDTTVQRTFYYATGMPMPESRGRSKQPNLYNGKEYESKADVSPDRAYVIGRSRVWRHCKCRTRLRPTRNNCNGRNLPTI